MTWFRSPRKAAMATATEHYRESLPAPADLPGADVVIYDGECQFCIQNMVRLHRWDGRGRIAFLPLQDPTVADRYPDLSHHDLLTQLYLIDGQGRRLGGAEAFRYLTLHLPRLWPLAPILHFPYSLPVWKSLYDWVAHRRYLLGGQPCNDGACRA